MSQTDWSFEKSIVSPEFSVEYYLKQLPSTDDIVDPITHYLEVGWRELRDPSPNFSTSFYITENPDVSKRGINPFFHYIVSGRKEGRFAHPKDPRKVAQDIQYEMSVIQDNFDEAFYLQQAPALSGQDRDAILRHFVEQGWRALLDPSPDFSTAKYLERHKDVSSQDINPLFHYLVAGKAENRQIFLARKPDEDSFKKVDPAANACRSEVLAADMTPEIIRALVDPRLFDIDYYRETNGLSGTDLEVVADFLAHPTRAGSPYFDPVFYAEQHKEIGKGRIAALQHYLTVGRDQKLRPSRIFDGDTVTLSVDETEKIIAASGLFDPTWYAYRNADVVKAKADLLKHYARVGHLEYKRTPNVLFDNTFYLQQAMDVRDHKWHPLVHYILLGSKRGLGPHALFDVKWFNTVRPSFGTGRTALAWLFEKAMVDGVGPNEFFDPSFYARICPESLQFPGGPISHYLDVGWKAGLDPSDRFSTKMYLDANPDVRRTKANPLYHFLASGRIEGRNPKPHPASIRTALERFGDPEYGGFDPVLRYDAEVTLPSRFSLSIAVHLHLYYPEMVDEFCHYLSNIPTRFHLFVSVPPGRGDLEKICAAFAARIKNCLDVRVASPVNRGRDVAPFLVEFGRALLAYDLVLHLHSKRSPHSPKHAGWRRYLLHYTLGNSSIVTQILTAFHADPHLGIFQPPYHPEVRAQPKWGDNRKIVTSLLNLLGLSYAGETCPHFPAGSFFWGRVDALRPLLEGRLKLEHFEEEAGQTDATAAHGVERLFGIIPLLRGYSVVSRFIDVAYNLINYYGKSRAFADFERDRTSEIVAYQKGVRARGGERGRIAVITAITGPFDALLLPDHLEVDIDYFCVTNSVTDGYGVFRLVPCPFLDADQRRTARFVKTNLLRLFPGYHFVVWVDANVLVRTSISDLVAATEASGRPIGAILHPIRASYLEEATEAGALRLDDSDVIEAQLLAYEAVEGLEKASLIETNFMVFDASNPETRTFQQLWWNQINKYSRRDQLSINYCLAHTCIDWFPLLPEYKSTRDSEHFALFRHGLNEWGPKPHIYGSWHQPNRFDGRLLPLLELHRWSRKAGALDLDVVVCVYNALEDVKLCLVSVEMALNGRGKIIIVDDCSGAETATFLKEFAATKGAVLVRHEERTGYTVAANDGVRAGSARNVLLLNSDTIVPAIALDKLSDALDRDALLGIVGPLSNAASAQSVPSTAGSGSQTAINPIPPGLTVADMDLFLERIWDGEMIRTPLVHGFCFCVKRAVFDRIGLFDEDNFPRGYGEENDFCFRAVDAGFDLAVHTGSYVFHAKSKSYADGERAMLMDAGMQALIRKHGKPRIARSVATINAQPSLERARNAVALLYEDRVSTISPRRGQLLLAPALRSDGLPAGSGFVRVLLPYGSAKICRDWEVSQLRSGSLPELSSKDVVLVQRDVSLLETGAIESWITGVKRSGARLIYEIDDDLLDAHGLEGRGFRGNVDDLGYRVMTFARAADVVTVSSDALLKKFSALNPNTTFIPNALDADLWRLSVTEPAGLRTAENRSSGEFISIGYIGTPTHDDDLALVREAIEDLQAKFPGRIDFQIIGGFGDAKKAFGSVIPLPLANDYPSFVRWLQKTVCWDIGVVPLAANTFNANKSYLKFLECGALGMAMVCSNGPEYGRVVQDRETGLLVENTKAAWLSALSYLVRQPEERVRLARNAFEAVRRDHTLDVIADRIMKALDARPSSLPKSNVRKDLPKPQDSQACA